MEVKYRVDGMTCGGCVRSVTTAIQAGNPLLQVEVSLPEKTVLVQGKHDEQSIRQAIEDAGFDYGGRL